MAESLVDNRSATRNHGIDLLRNLSMFMVVILHVLGLGGLLIATKGQGIRYELLKVIHIGSMCAVNCYGLIFGYVGYGSKWKISSIITLWLQVFLYSVGIGLLFCVLKPGSVGLKDLVKFSMPVLFQRYWYFTAYFALFFTIPLLNTAIQNIPRRLFEVSFGVLLFLLSVCQQTVIVNNPFGTNSGYSYLWLIVLYCIGGYLAKYQIKPQKQLIPVIIYAGCVSICWIVQFFMNRLGMSVPERLEGYNSPFVLGMGMALLVLFANAKVPKWLVKLSAIFAPVSFGVYLLHLHPCVHDHILQDAFAPLANQPAWILMPLVFVITLGIYILCSAIDYIRLRLFRLIRIKAMLIKIDNKIFPNDGGSQ